MRGWGLTESAFLFFFFVVFKTHTAEPSAQGRGMCWLQVEFDLDILDTFRMKKIEIRKLSSNNKKTH